MHLLMETILSCRCICGCRCLSQRRISDACSYRMDSHIQSSHVTLSYAGVAALWRKYCTTDVCSCTHDANGFCVLFARLGNGQGGAPPRDNGNGRHGPPCLRLAFNNSDKMEHFSVNTGTSIPPRHEHGHRHGHWEGIRCLGRGPEPGVNQG